MNLGSFVNQQSKYIMSMPVPVRMAGFESNTLNLQNSGWQISVEARREWAFDGYDIRVAFKHDGIKQMALGVMRFTANSAHENLITEYFKYGIDICYIAPQIQVQRITAPHGMSMNFQAIDARPMITELRGLDEFAMFKPIKSEDFELYIHQKDEQEILDFLLKKQDPKQKELRQNRKRRDYVAGNEGSLLGIDDNINTDIKHQIVLVS